MNFLENMLGGQQHKRQQYQDFVNRYDEGPPWAGISDDEAIDRYSEVEQHLPPDVYEQSAEEAFARMSPQERRQFGHYLRQQARQQNFNFPDLDQDGIDDRFEDPRFMAQMTGRMHRQQPGMFGQLATGGQMRRRRQQGQRRRQKKDSNLLGNPLAKAALAGIAAIAVKKMM